VIDLHVHTTASDGSLAPGTLVAEARAAGIRVLAITDHDTVAGVPGAVRAGGSDLTVVPGIEITAVEAGRDVHVLAYFLDAGWPELEPFLARQRGDRRRRVLEIIDRLTALGVPVDPAPLLAGAAAAGDRSLGRPMIAAALVRAGHVADIGEAFDRYLGAGRPAFVERRGSSAADVVALIGRAGGLASFAHPGTTGRDDLLPGLARAGLAAIEAHHPDHDEETTARYRRLAEEMGLAVTGGSDYHGPGDSRARRLGQAGVSTGDYARFLEWRERRRRSP
jgi:predicted metal-dependent phosphoesterase TrpH